MQRLTRRFISSRTIFRGLSTTTEPMSIIEKAKAHGAQSLVGPFVHRGGFDSCLDGMTIESMDGKAVATLPVVPKLGNSWQTLHGGAVSTLVDVMGTLALLAADPNRGGVSIEMNMSFLAPVKVGDVVLAEGEVIKTGKSLGFTEVRLFRKSDGKQIAIGRHTKAF